MICFNSTMALRSKSQNVRMTTARLNLLFAVGMIWVAQFPKQLGDLWVWQPEDQLIMNTESVRRITIGIAIAFIIYGGLKFIGVIPSWATRVLTGSLNVWLPILPMDLKGLKGTGRDLSSAHFQHTQKRGVPTTFHNQLNTYIPATQRRGFLVIRLSSIAD